MKGEFGSSWFDTAAAGAGGMKIGGFGVKKAPPKQPVREVATRRTGGGTERAAPLCQALSWPAPGQIGGQT
jgi:hypothetical protein